ncbi:MAG: DUF116 domain-containing protein [Deferribacteraceae bacterium]|jgi:hypothetical protein|nr:DUF116 domain-containing protein [Deferribacteraceae bacterium]
MGGLFAAGVFTVMTAFSRYYPPLRDYAVYAFMAIMALGGVYAIILTISVILRREGIIPTRKVIIRYMTKFADSLARRIGFDSNRLARSFIMLNNDYVEKTLKKDRKNIKRVLILLPHCIQLASCVFKVTTNVNNCRKCGKCVISSFLRMSETFAFDMFVSTGGTMARFAVKERQPDLILAVACEKDLMSGIKDTLGLAVIGILNRQPNGPCYNTTVDPEAVEAVLKNFN